MSIFKKNNVPSGLMEVNSPEAQQNVQPQMQEENPFTEAVEELMTLVEQGKIPEGVDLEEACQDEGFAQLLQELPAYAALRVYKAEQEAKNAKAAAMEELTVAAENRRALPRMTRSNRSVAPQEDYMNMSPEAFRTLEAMMKRNRN